MLFPDTPVISNVVEFFDWGKESSFIPEGNETPKTHKVQGIFYRILSQEQKAIGHLLGVVHVANKEVLYLNEPIREAVKKADSIYLEIVPGKMPDIDLLKDLEEPQREKLEKFVQLAFPRLILKLLESGASFEGLSEINYIFNEAGFDSAKKLGLVSMLLEQLIVYRAKIVCAPGQDLSSTGPPLGIDRLLVSYAREVNKQLRSLEDGQERLGSIKQALLGADRINYLPSNEQEVESHIEKNCNCVIDSCNAWIDGDEDCIKKIFTSNREEDSNFYTEINTKRNIAMANKIDEVLHSQEEGKIPFFAVGSIHVLDEEESIVGLLREKGWTVERVMNREEIAVG